jgi:hypothetical protein
MGDGSGAPFLPFPDVFVKPPELPFIQPRQLSGHDGMNVSEIFDKRIPEKPQERHGQADEVACPGEHLKLLLGQLAPRYRGPAQPSKVRVQVTHLAVVRAGNRPGQLQPVRGQIGDPEVSQSAPRQGDVVGESADGSVLIGGEA